MSISNVAVFFCAMPQLRRSRLPPAPTPSVFMPCKTGCDHGFSRNARPVPRHGGSDDRGGQRESNVAKAWSSLVAPNDRSGSRFRGWRRNLTTHHEVVGTRLSMAWWRRGNRAASPTTLSCGTAARWHQRSGRYQTGSEGTSIKAIRSREGYFRSEGV